MDASSQGNGGKKKGSWLVAVEGLSHFCAGLGQDGGMRAMFG